MVIPLTIQQVNWPHMLAAIKDIEGRDLGRALDLADTKLGCPFAFIKVVQTFSGVELERVGKILSFSFLTDCSGLESFDLEILKSNRLVGLSIVAGNLSQWAKAVINGSTALKSFEVVDFFNGVYQIFESYGLKVLWDDYRKLDSGLGVFHLEHK